MRQSRTAFLALGSNVGDRMSNLRTARDLLGRTPGITVIAEAPVYETEPLGVAEQPWFLNTVIEVSTVLPPPALLVAAKKVELAVGRTASYRWGPREIDVDILLYQGERQDTEELTIPHPRMAERLFVLLPLRDLNSQWQNAEGVGIEQLIERLQDMAVVRPYPEAL